jgi:hypothetical protein
MTVRQGNLRHDGPSCSIGAEPAADCGLTVKPRSFVRCQTLGLCEMARKVALISKSESEPAFGVRPAGRRSRRGRQSYGHSLTRANPRQSNAPR